LASSALLVIVVVVIVVNTRVVIGLGERNSRKSGRWQKEEESVAGRIGEGQ
jgi:hypothetical protein